MDGVILTEIIAGAEVQSLNRRQCVVEEAHEHWSRGWIREGRLWPDHKATSPR